MTSKQLAYIRARWQGQLVDNDEGDCTDDYLCIVCGELAAQRSLARSIETASPHTT